MHPRLSLPLLLLAAIAPLPGARGADAPPKGKVLLTVDGDREQPAGWPLLVEVALKNSGDSPISWWCGGPDRFPGGQDFDVQVRYGSDNEWHQVTATNGQYVQGSGVSETLQPGKSIVVPLAIPVRRVDGMHIRIRTKPWDSGDPVEKYMQVRSERGQLDKRQALVIAAVVGQTSPFLQHVAERYADATVVDALLKLATVDNGPVAASAARSLSRQKTLPTEAGEDLAKRLVYWSGPGYQREYSTLCADLSTAALRTQSEAARGTVLKLLTESDRSEVQISIMESLMVSPGDGTWLRRAKAAVDAVPAAAENLAAQKQRVSNWLNARITIPQ